MEYELDMVLDPGGLSVAGMESVWVVVWALGVKLGLVY